MSENVGDQIPPPLRFEMGQHPAASEPVRAFLLLTVDDDGQPRVAVLAPTEVRAVDERRASISVRAGTSTQRNLARGSAALLWCVLDGAAYSLRGSTHAVIGRASLAPNENHATFELLVTEVLRDFYPTSPMIAGPTFRRTEHT